MFLNIIIRLSIIIFLSNLTLKLKQNNTNMNKLVQNYLCFSIEVFR